MHRYIFNLYTALPDTPPVTTIVTPHCHVACDISPDPVTCDMYTWFNPLCFGHKELCLVLYVFKFVLLMAGHGKFRWLILSILIMEFSRIFSRIFSEFFQNFSRELDNTNTNTANPATASHLMFIHTSCSYIHTSLLY